jgi:hypothetical protein
VIWLGLAMMAVSETATLLRVEPFWSWNTPIAWTGFIIFADSVTYRVRGESWIRSAPREFALLALLSIPLWLIFEGYNQVIDNWYYTGLPENIALGYFGYAWSFATISPAIFEGAELIGVARGSRGPGGSGGSGGSGRSGGSGGSGGPGGPGGSGLFMSDAPDRPGPPRLPGLLSVSVGALMLASPFLVSPAVARYLAAPVWLGFIFLLDPINARLGAESLWVDWRAGRLDRTINLALSGFRGGVLGEFWNYWAGAKWHYAVPIMEQWKIFEMPLPGYFGFPPFALECFTMYVFVRRLLSPVVSRFSRTVRPVRQVAR